MIKQMYRYIRLRILTFLFGLFIVTGCLSALAIFGWFLNLIGFYTLKAVGYSLEIGTTEAIEKSIVAGILIVAVIYIIYQIGKFIIEENTTVRLPF